MSNKLKLARELPGRSGHSDPDPNENAATAIAMVSADLAHRMSSIYHNELSDFLNNLVPEHTTEDQKQHLSYSRLMKSELARDVMAIIWRNSQFVSPEALKIAGLQRPLEDQELTKHSISKLIVRGMDSLDFDRVNATQMAINRIASALAYFGLIEYKEIRNNFKAIEGTERLHRFMQSVNTKLASELNAMFSQS